MRYLVGIAICCVAVTADAAWRPGSQHTMIAETLTAASTEGAGATYQLTGFLGSAGVAGTFDGAGATACLGFWCGEGYVVVVGDDDDDMDDDDSKSGDDDSGDDDDANDDDDSTSDDDDDSTSDDDDSGDDDSSSDDDDVGDDGIALPPPSAPAWSNSCACGPAAPSPPLPLFALPPMLLRRRSR